MRASSARRLQVLEGATLSAPSFDEVLDDHGLVPLVRTPVRTLQVNVGKL